MQNVNYYPDELAERLIDATVYRDNDEFRINHQKQCEEALYWLKAAAENPYNQPCFASLYEVLENVARSYFYERKQDNR